MFDRTVVMAGGEHHHTHRHEITEKRAPTDESVRLLREMEKAAQDKLLGSFRLEGCEVDCIVHHEYGSMQDEHRFAVQYRLGSKKHVVRHTFRANVSENENDARYRLAAELVRAVGESIACELLLPAMNRALPLHKFKFT